MNILKHQDILAEKYLGLESLLSHSIFRNEQNRIGVRTKEKCSMKINELKIRPLFAVQKLKCLKKT